MVSPQDDCASDLDYVYGGETGWAINEWRFRSSWKVDFHERPSRVQHEQIVFM